MMKTGLWTLSLACLLCAGACAEEGAPIMRKVSGAYSALRACSYQSNALVTLRANGVSTPNGSTAEVRIQMPNRFFLRVSSPKTGSIVAWSDGSIETIYNGIANSYVKGAAPANLSEFMRSLRRYGIASALDPIYFLQGGKAETVTTGLKATGATTLDGVPCLIVKGSLKGFRAPASGNVTFWVDRQTYLLRKVQIATNNLKALVPVVTRRKGKPVRGMARVTASQTITVRIQEMQTSPALTQASFRYSMPKGAAGSQSDKPLWQ